MAIFPQIGDNGMMVQRPYTRAAVYRTTFEDQPTGRRHSWYWRSSPLHAFELHYSTLTLAEFDTVRSFFVSQKGRYGEFIFVDPTGNLIPDTSSYETGSSDPFGGNRAMSGGTISSTQILASGHELNGFVLCASVWAKSSSPGNTVNFTMTSCNPSSGSFTIPTTSGWFRAYLTTTVSSTNAISFGVSGSATYIFGPTVTATKGPGQYLASPAHYALRSKCRFDTDELSVKYSGVHSYDIMLPILEYA